MEQDEHTPRPTSEHVKAKRQRMEVLRRNRRNRERMSKLPTPEECFERAKELAHEINDELDARPELGILPEEWYMYPENVIKLIEFCQREKQ